MLTNSSVNQFTPSYYIYKFLDRVYSIVINLNFKISLQDYADPSISTLTLACFVTK